MHRRGRQEQSVLFDFTETVFVRLPVPIIASVADITLLCFDFNDFLVTLERMVSVFQVLLQAQKELLVYSDTGISVLGE